MDTGKVVIYSNTTLSNTPSVVTGLTGATRISVYSNNIYVISPTTIWSINKTTLIATVIYSGSNIRGLTVNSNNNLIFAMGSAIYWLQNDTTPVLLAGDPNISGWADGYESDVRFSSNIIAITSVTDQIIYVADDVHIRYLNRYTKQVYTYCDNIIKDNGTSQRYIIKDIKHNGSYPVISYTGAGGINFMQLSNIDTIRYIPKLNISMPNATTNAIYTVLYQNIQTVEYKDPVFKLSHIINKSITNFTTNNALLDSVNYFDVMHVPIGVSKEQLTRSLGTCRAIVSGSDISGLTFDSTKDNLYFCSENNDVFKYNITTGEVVSVISCNGVGNKLTGCYNLTNGYAYVNTPSEADILDSITVSDSTNLANINRNGLNYRCCISTVDINGIETGVIYTTGVRTDKFLQVYIPVLTSKTNKVRIYLQHNNDDSNECFEYDGLLGDRWVELDPYADDVNMYMRTPSAFYRGHASINPFSLLWNDINNTLLVVDRQNDRVIE